MRWERMFADLDAQYDAAEAGEFASEVADRSRREVALVSLADRLRAAPGRISVGLQGHAAVAGTVAALGADWLLVAEESAEILVPFVAVLWVRALPVLAATELSPIAARLDLGYALRGIARDREAVTLLLTDGSAVAGTIDRVGRDFLDVAEHPVSELRRSDVVTASRTVAFRALAAARRS